jgi:hypothetical protein
VPCSLSGAASHLSSGDKTICHRVRSTGMRELGMRSIAWDGPESG